MTVLPLIPSLELKSGDVVRHHFETEFGDHKIEGHIKDVSELVDRFGNKYVRVTWEEAKFSDVRLHTSAELYGREGLRLVNYVSPHAVQVHMTLLSAKGDRAKMNEYLQRLAMPSRSDVQPVTIWMVPGLRSDEKIQVLTVQDDVVNFVSVDGDGAIASRSVEEFLELAKPVQLLYASSNI